MHRIVHRLIAVLALVIFVLVQKPLPTQATPVGGARTTIGATATRAGNVWYGCFLHLDYATGTHIVRRQCHTYAMPREHRHRVGWEIIRVRFSPHTGYSIRWPTFYVPPPPAPPLSGFPPLVARWTPYIYEASRVTGINPRVIAGVIFVESSGIPTVSSLGGIDIGLTQYGPNEAAIVGGVWTFDPRLNILTGSKYLEYLRERYAGGNLYTAVAMYNGGSGNPQYGYAARVYAWV